MISAEQIRQADLNQNMKPNTHEKVYQALKKQKPSAKGLSTSNIRGINYGTDSNKSQR